MPTLCLFDISKCVRELFSSQDDRQIDRETNSTRSGNSAFGGVIK